MTRRFLTLVLLAAGVAAGTAHADVTIISEVSVSTASGATSVPSHLVTTYYQDGKVRVQSDSGEILLYDLKARNVYRLNPSAKTYAVVPIGQLPPELEDWNQKLQSKPKLDSNIKVKAKSDKKTVAGMDATNVELTATVRPEMTNNNRGGGGFGGGGGGGFGGGGFGGGGFGGGRRHGGGGGGGNGDSSGGGGPRGGVTINGEYWMSPALPLGNQKTDDPLTLLPLYAETVAESRITVASLEDMTKKLNQQQKGAPVASRVEVEATSPDGRTFTVVTSEIKSISLQPVDRSLFYPSAEYRQVYPVQVQTSPSPNP